MGLASLCVLWFLGVSAYTYTPPLKHNARILARNRASRAKQYVVRSSSEHHNFSSLGYKPGALARHP
jgi:hypothetical protein